MYCTFLSVHLPRVNGGFKCHVKQHYGGIGAW